ncbi:MAG: MazG nucleotide pyrophosphohydrolase domain-containing protein [Bacilli bacterium]
MPKTRYFLYIAMKDDSVDKLVEIVKRLRAPDGCPWDREQTHLSVRGHLVEECAELLEAIDNEDSEAMREELGDVLMHILLHSEIESERGNFDFYDVARSLRKLIRRHPHVFGGNSAQNSDDVLKIWQDVKSKENKPRAVGDYSGHTAATPLCATPTTLQKRPKSSTKRSRAPKEIFLRRA